MINVKAEFNPDKNGIETSLETEGEEENSAMVLLEAKAATEFLIRFVGANSDMTPMEFIKTIASDIEDGNGFFPKDNE